MKEDDFLNNLAPFPVWVDGRKIELCPIEFRKIEKKYNYYFAKPKCGFKKGTDFAKPKPKSAFKN